MDIKISDKEVVVDGRVYVFKLDHENEFCGRREIAEMLGYRKADGSPNCSNLYRNTPNAVLQFPNFEIEKAERGEKPWRRREVRAWLSIPLWERKRMYKETKDEADEQD